MNKKVIVGMSGGVDSSVAAALLKEQGYDVIGVTMRLWENHNEADISDAKKVADILGIEHRVVVFKKEFKDTVIQYFVDEYLSGRTPNPCMYCNQKLKFGKMLEYALEQGADYVATGHYASIEKNELSGRYLLKKAGYLPKDQSYFLYGLTQQQLSHTLFPLNSYGKDKIRELAEQYGLNIAHKSESQDICFVPDGDYGKVIKSYSGQELQEGDFVDINGNVLGRHQGIWKYTIGQRKGLGIAFGTPMYVVEIDAQNSRVVLGEDLFSDTLTATNLNWISISTLEQPIEVEAKIRYLAKPARATIKMIKPDVVQVDFVEKQRAITPGQAIVFYNGDTVVGGGIIEK